MLKQIHFLNFRNFENAEFFLDGKTVAFVGGNGKGKTSILEGIYFCSTLRSFRTSKIRELKKIGTKEFDIDLLLRKKDAWDVRLKITEGIQRGLFIDDVPIRKSSEFIDAFQTVAFLPDDPVIVTGSPSFRRRFIDIFLCMTDREYFIALQRYVKALKNRNFLLKTGRIDRRILSSYSVPLAEAGSIITVKRIEMLEKLEKTVSSIMTEMRPSLSEFKIVYRFAPEMTEKTKYEEKLQADLEKDIARFSTCSGPHVDDFDLFISGKSLKSYGSRGQCRMTSLAMKLSELRIVSEKNGKVVVLVDDAMADLDPDAKKSFIERISGAEQIFYAFTELPGDDYFEKVIRI